MKKIYFFICAILALYSCSNDDLHDKSLPSGGTNARTINQTGSKDGVSYTLKNLTVNPNLVKLSPENIILISSKNDMENGKFNFEILSKEIEKELIPGNIIYLKTGENSFFRKIASVTQTNNLFSLETTEAYVGDIFENGTLELSINTKEVEKNINSKNNSLIALRGSYDNSFTFNIFEHIQEYKYGGMTLNPNTSITSTLNMKLGFAKSQLLPNEVEVYYEINTSIKPYFLFNGNVNQKFNHDLSENIPENLVDLLKKIEVDVNIPTGNFLGDIPAKISVDKINFPIEIEANVEKTSHLALNSSGTFKIGFAYYNGIPGKTNHFIYENSITNSGVTESNLVGEVISDMKISIIPKIKLFDTDLIDVKGNIVFGVNSFTIGNGSISESSNFASQGNFYSSGIFSFGTLGITLYTTEVLKENKELWNIGSYTKTMTFSNFASGNASLLPCSGLTSFSYDILLNYKYPISGKTLSGGLEMTYDVYADNGSLLESQKTIKISPNNITTNSFKFNMCIPFRRINIFQISKISYLKNITIKDANGYTAKGISDPLLGNILSEVKLTR